MDPKNRLHFCRLAKRPVKYPLIMLALESGIYLILNSLGELSNVIMFRWGCGNEREIKIGVLMKSRQDRVVFFAFPWALPKAGLPSASTGVSPRLRPAKRGGLDRAIICSPFARQDDVISR